MADLDSAGSTYVEDVNTDAQGGEVVINRATVMWNLTVSIETATTVIVSLSDSNTAYEPDNRKEKIVIDGPGTVAIAYPKGKKFLNGIWAVASAESADIGITHD